MKINKVKKAMIIVLVISLIVFAIINLLWVFCVKLPYNKYTEYIAYYQDEYDSELRNITVDIGQYSYTVKVPGYLDFESFLSVGPAGGISVNFDENGEIIEEENDSILLFIWPDMWGNYEYGVTFFLEDKSTLMAMCDENGNYLPTDDTNVEKNEYLSGFFAEKQEMIQETLEHAKEVFHIE